MVAVAALLVCALTLTVQAQNVTISPTTGSLVSAVTSENETGFKVGLSTLWRHEQLQLSLTSSDEDDITDAGEIAKPAASIGKFNGNLIIAGGHRPTFLVVSLPKGYRITSYEMVLANDLIGKDICPGVTLTSDQGFKTLNSNSGTMRFYETKPWTTGGTNGNGTYNQLDPTGSEIIAQAKAADNDTEINSGTGSADEGKEYIISRSSQTDTDMGNQLYFRLTKNYFYYGLTIKSFEIHFTAEGTFDVTVAPTEKDEAQRVVMSPFATSKTDIGKLDQHTKDGATYFSYDYQSVRDLRAYNYLYQQGAVENGVPHEVESVRPHISPVTVDGQNRYAFENDVYYVEPPVSVHTSSGLESPVGYRIVGAKFDYLWGTATEGGTETLVDAYYIQVGNYYLNDQLAFTTREFAWSYDQETQQLYTGTGDNIRYLSCEGSGDNRRLTTSTEKVNWYNLIVFTRDGNTYVGWDNEISSQRYYLRRRNNGNPRVDRDNKTNAVGVTVNDSHSKELADYNPGAYTLEVYGTDKNTPMETITVNSASDTGTYELKNLNNDAVKFKISGLGTTEAGQPQQALVNVTLQLQALDPYINSMDIVCENVPEALQMTQTFTASDFRVSGGEFVFYVPKSMEGKQVSLKFADLYSDYGDETYYGQSLSLHKSRYSFVTSDYFFPVNGNGNDGLYDANYSPDATYKDKVFTSTAGNIRFKFNNAEDLGEEGVSNYLEEYPFSVTDYLASTDPDATANPAQGAFVTCEVTAGDGSQEAGTFYLFTADETRYNIAPTTAWQHRAYAFYRMDIKVVAKSYEPEFVWVPVYDEGETLYMDNDGKAASKSQWGLTLKTTETGSGAKYGYLTVKDINDAITATLGKAGCPESADQILYIDASDLYAVVSDANGTLNDLKSGLGANSLIYLPANTTSNLDNMAYKTISGSFRAGGDIVLTDKKPFYAPYDIQTVAPNYATYTRQLTVDKYNKSNYVSLIVPFDLTTDNDGKHVNNQGVTGDDCEFVLYQMNESDCISIDENHKGYNYFSEAKGMEQQALMRSLAPANKPYLVDVTKGYIDISKEESPTIFVASQVGATVKATTDMTEDAKGNSYTFTGEENCQGSYPGGAISFTNNGIYSGKILDVSGKNEGYYYLGNDNKLVCSDDLKSTITTVKLLPFRSYYTSTKSGSNSNRLMQFNIVFGKNEQGDQTGISRIENVKENGAVYDLQGRRVENPTKGLYIVNGKKVMVK